MCRTPALAATVLALLAAPALAAETAKPPSAAPAAAAVRAKAPAQQRAEAARMDPLARAAFWAANWRSTDGTPRRPSACRGPFGSSTAPTRPPTCPGAPWSSRPKTTTC